MLSTCDHLTDGHEHRHAALFYEGEQGFLDAVVPFLLAGAVEGEPAFVVIPGRKIEGVRHALGDAAPKVEFADMDEVGDNPARIIPAWLQFTARHDGRRLRGVGEPISADRTGAELRECQHHERLLNRALEGSNLNLLCPYDTTALDPAVVEEARRSHPVLEADGAEEPSGDYVGRERAAELLEEELPERPREAELLPTLSLDDLPVVRSFVARQAQLAGLSEKRSADLVLAVNELVSNSVRHGGGRGTLSVWRDDGSLVVEVRDGGRIDDPLADRRPPTPGEVGNRGLWLANQLCDLVQLRSLDGGVVARAHMRAA